MDGREKLAGTRKENEVEEEGNAAKGIRKEKGEALPDLLRWLGEE